MILRRSLKNGLTRWWEGNDVCFLAEAGILREACLGKEPGLKCAFYNQLDIYNSRIQMTLSRKKYST
jgi:hypothetical protein